MTLLYDSPTFLKHDTGKHPETAERLRAIDAMLDASGLPDVLTPRCGARPNSPTASTKVSSSKPRSSRSPISEESPASSMGPDWVFMRVDKPV